MQQLSEILKIIPVFLILVSSLLAATPPCKGRNFTILMIALGADPATIPRLITVDPPHQLNDEPLHNLTFRNLLEKIPNAQDPQNPQRQWSRNISAENAEEVYDVPSQTVYRFEVELAKKACYPLETVVALVRNFFGTSRITDSNLSDAAVGVMPELGRRPDGSALIHVNRNLLQAYENLNRRLELGNVTGELLTEIGKLAFVGEVYFDRTAGVYKQKENNLTLREPGKVSTPLSTTAMNKTVLAMMAEYGQEVRGGRIHFPDYPTYEWCRQNPNDPRALHHPQFALDRLAEDINILTNLRAPAHLVAAYAVQRLIVIHPFVDWNGRTGRLLGQVLYEKIMLRNTTETFRGNVPEGWSERVGRSTIIFPRQFQAEANHSVGELAKLALGRLLEPPRDMNTLHPQFSAKTTREFFHQLIFFGARSDIPIVVGRAQTDQRGVQTTDNPFGNFTYKNAPVNYANLPRGCKMKSEDPVFVYYGTAGNFEQLSALKFLRGNTVGSYDRKSRDLFTQLQGQNTESREVGGEPTIFSPTSEQSLVAFNFGQRARGDHVVVFIIDPRGADILNVRRTLEHIKPGESSTYGHEGEIDFDGRIIGTRFLASMKFPKETVQTLTGPRRYAEQVPTEFRLNPRYQSKD